MKKFFILFLFIASGLIAFFVTKSISGKSASDDISVEPIEDIDSFEVYADTIDTIVVEPIVTPEPTPDDPIIEPKPEPNVGPKCLDNPSPAKHVNISLSEVKKLIESGRYDKDPRISKTYSIEYIDVNEDDMEGLKQNLTSIQEDFITTETWRDFEVVGLGHDEKTGLVNLFKIRPIY